MNIREVLKDVKNDYEDILINSEKSLNDKKSKQQKTDFYTKMRLVIILFNKKKDFINLLKNEKLTLFGRCEKILLDILKENSI